MTFQIGDRIEAIATHLIRNSCISKGDTGVVCDVSDPNFVGVRWDRRLSVGHNCQGNCDDGHGRYVYPGEIKLCEEEEDDGTEIEEFSFMNMIGG